MEIVVRPFPGDFPLGGLFDSAATAQGQRAWFEMLARTTLACGEQAIIVVALLDGSPRGALPLVRTRGGLRALTAPYTTVFAPPLGEPEIAYELGRCASQYVPSTLRLDGLDAAEPASAAFLDGLSRAGLASARYGGFANWYEPVGDFESWWNRRPSRLKATVRRKLAAASKQDATFALVSGDFDEPIAAYEDIYGRSWKTAEPHPGFVRAMVAALAREGLVRMGVMKLGGRPVAAQIWLVCGRRATIFKLAHREDAAALSPGTLLTYRMARALIAADQLCEIDFGRGDDAYKRDWLSSVRTRTGVIAADWRNLSGFRALVKDILPTRLGSFIRAFRRQAAGNHFGSVAATYDPKLSAPRLHIKRDGVGLESRAEMNR